MGGEYYNWSGPEDSGGGGGDAGENYGGGGGGYSEPAAPSQEQAAAVVEQMYQEVLGRAPDAGGQAAFVEAVMSGADVAALAQSMANSQEAQNRGITQQAQAVANNIAADTAAYVQQVVTKQYNNDFVQNLYYGVLGRAPDAAGLQNNLNLLNSGQISPDQLAAAFAASREAQTNSIANGQEQQAAQQVVGTYGQPTQNRVDAASGDWTGVTAVDLAKAGITNPAILSAAATGTLNSNIFGSFKTDANIIANALNTGTRIPAQQVQQLNTASSITGAPTGTVVGGQNIGNGQTVYYYSNGGSVTVDAKGKPVSISLGKEAYRQASTSGDSASLAVADNPGTAMFNGQVVSVSAPKYQWNPSTNSIQNTEQGIPMAYREPTSGGFGADLAKFDKAVGDTIPGGWSTVAAVALAVATYGASAGLTEGAMMAADASSLAASGLSQAQIAQVIGQSYAISAEAAAAIATSAVATTSAAAAGVAVEGISAAEIAAVQQGTADALAATGTGGQIAGTGTGIVTGGGSGAIVPGYTGVMGPGVAQTFSGAVTYGGLSSAGMNALTQLATTGDINLNSVLTAAVTGAITGGAANQFLDPALTLTAALKNGAITGVGSNVVNAVLTGQPITAQSLALSAALGATINGIANQITLPNGAIRQYFADGSTSTIDPTTGQIALTESTLMPGDAVPVSAPDGSLLYYAQGADGNPVIYNADGSLNAQQTASFSVDNVGDPNSAIAGDGVGIKQFDTKYFDQATQTWKPVDTTYSDTGGIKGESATSSGSMSDIPTVEQLQFELKNGMLTQDEFNSSVRALQAGNVGSGTGGFGVTAPFVPSVFTPTQTKIPGTNVNIVNPQTPGTGGTGTTPGQTGGSTGNQGSGSGGGPGPGTGYTGTTGSGGGGTGGFGSGGGGTGGFGSGGGGGGFGSGGGGGGFGSGGGGGGFAPLVPYVPGKTPGTTSTSTSNYKYPGIGKFSGDLDIAGLNPGWMNQGVRPMYQTTNDVQSQYYWGGHPYMPDYASLRNYNVGTAAPARPFGIREIQQQYDLDTLLGGITQYGQPAETPLAAAAPNPMASTAMAPVAPAPAPSASATPTLLSSQYGYVPGQPVAPSVGASPLPMIDPLTGLPITTGTAMAPVAPVPA